MVECVGRCGYLSCLLCNINLKIVEAFNITRFIISYKTCLRHGHMPFELFHFCICLCMFSSPYFVYIFHVWFQDLGFLNLVYFACLISPYSLARQCAVLWSKTRESLGHPLGTVAEPNHLVVQKEVLEAAVRKVCVSRLLCSFFIPISFLTLVLLFPFN